MPPAADPVIAGRPSRPGINWELLRTDALRQLRAQPGWLAAGLLGPLLIVLYTLLRPWLPRHAERDLLQAAIFLSAWNCAFPLLYAASVWLRPHQDSAERELFHLPLSAVHFTLRRLAQTSALPLAAALLALPLWAVLLVYHGVPYGVDGDQARWVWPLGAELANPWWPRMLWVASALLSAALLPAALVAWLNELVPVRWLRCILAFGLPVGLYFAVRLAAGTYDPAYGGYWVDYGPWLMNYRQTRGVDALPYLVMLGCALLGPLLLGWLRPALRWVLLGLPLLLCGAFLLREALPEELRAPLRPVSSALFDRDARYAAGLFVGHLSPPRNIRLLWRSYPSNILFASDGLGPEPDYPTWNPGVEWPDPANYATAEDSAAAQAEYAAATERYQVEFDEQQARYEAAMQVYNSAYSAAPRLPLWVGAGLYPLLLPLWAVAGLLLGIELRR